MHLILKCDNQLLEVDNALLLEQGHAKLGMFIFPRIRFD